MEHDIACKNTNYPVRYRAMQGWSLQELKEKRLFPVGNNLSRKDRQRHTLPLGVAVPSARVGLTTLFGMGRGEHHCYSHRKAFCGDDPADRLSKTLMTLNERKHND